MTCANCGREAAPSDVYCRNCGARLQAEGTAAGDFAGGIPNGGAGSGGSQGYRPYSQPGYARSSYARPVRDPTIAFILEVLPGLFGILGIGHMYAGNIPRGLILLVVWFLFVTGEVTTGVICCFFPLNFVVPVLSGLWAKRELDGEPLPFGR